MNENMKRVCIVNNLYALFQYLLISTEKEIEETFFFFERGVPDIVAKKFQNAVQLHSPRNRVLKLLFQFKLHLFSSLKYPFLKKSTFWGQDNISITSPLLKKKTMNIMEDGVLNYTYKPFLPYPKWTNMFRAFISGKLATQYPLGYSNFVHRIYLTGLFPIPEAIKSKVKIINLQSLWNNISQMKREWIINIFGVDFCFLDSIKKIDTILFTQPLSEDSIISEEEKIEIYRDILENIEGDVLIKVHPREKTNYKIIFPNVEVLDSPIPFELLSLVGVRFSHVYTIFSTAALTIPYQTDLHFLGTRMYPDILRKVGDVVLTS